MQARYDAKNPPALQRLLGHGVQLVPFPEDVMAAAREASDQPLSDLSSESADFARILEAWQGYRKGAATWFGTAERAFLNAGG